MAKAATIKIKLLSTADTGFFYVDQEERPHQDRQAVVQEVRPGRAQARRVQGNQDQVIPSERPDFGRARERPFCV